MIFQCLRQNRTVWLLPFLAWLACQSTAFAADSSIKAGSHPEKITSSVQSSAHSKAINKSPLFDKPDGWGAGFALATGHGPGVVVGPGSTNPNVFAQAFPARAGQQFKVVARASSFDKPESTAAIQVNWLGEKGRFVSVLQEQFKVTSSERDFQITAVVPQGATQGILYVVPGGKKDAVRYTEMSLFRLKPIRDFMSYEFLGIKGRSLLASSVPILLLAFLYTCFRKSLFRTGALLIGGIGSGVARFFPLLALLLCGTVFIVMEGNYEQHYDSQWHQASIESVMQWNDVSPDLGGNPLHNFGIQHVINPQLSPTFWIGKFAPADHRIQVQAAFQAMLLFLILAWLCRLAGARSGDAYAISLIAVYYYWVPFLSDEAITLNATLGLLWQEGAIATLLAYFCFSRIGYGDSCAPPSLSKIGWPTLGFAATILWLYLAYPELIAFFTLATAALCLGAVLGAQSRRELLCKFGAAIVVVSVLLAIGIYNYVLNLFLYTPQMYFKALYNHDFQALFFSNTSLLLASSRLGGAKVVVFFVLAAAGTFLALRFGNRFARHIAFGGLALEAAIHFFSAVNTELRLAPLTFTYVEQMGLTVVALLAGTAVWSVIRVIFWLIPKGYDRIAPSGSRISDLLSPELMIGKDQTFSYLALLCLVALVFYRLSIHINFNSGWPPRTDSAPARIQAQELAVNPGDTFKGKAAVLLGMDNAGPALWGHNFFPIIYFRYRDELGNDLMNDAEVAGIPVVNEYGHWISPPMLALLTAAFYHPGDYIDRAAQAPRAFRPNLARLLGVSLVVSDKSLPGEVSLYRGQAGGHPLYIHRIAGANLGQYSPTRTVFARDAARILDHLQSTDFDGRALAIVETPLEHNLVQAERVSVSFHKGPRIHVEASSQGISLLVLPFDYSHCLEVEGQGLDQLIPVNLAQTGLVVRGKVALDISYRYGLLKGTSCRKQDLERIKKLGLEEAATGRLFHDSRPARSGTK